jgi:hypothetical protein
MKKLQVRAVGMRPRPRHSVPPERPRPVRTRRDRRYRRLEERLLAGAPAGPLTVRRIASMCQARPLARAEQELRLAGPLAVDAFRLRGRRLGITHIL